MSTANGEDVGGRVETTSTDVEDGVGSRVGVAGSVEANGVQGLQGGGSVGPGRLGGGARAGLPGIVQGLG